LPYYRCIILDVGVNVTEISSDRKMSTLIPNESETKRLIKELAEEGGQPSTIKQILMEAKPEWKLLTFCCFASVIQGMAMPASSILFNQVNNT
jgi:hypothetical protein